MVRRTGPTNNIVQELIAELQGKTVESRFWKRIVKDLQKPTRERRTVNIYKIDKFAREGETIIVPGKVLSVGTLNKKVDVAAMNFSDEARNKIISAQGKVLSIKELLTQNPEGKNVRILG